VVGVKMTVEADEQSRLRNRDCAIAIAACVPVVEVVIVRDHIMHD